MICIAAFGVSEPELIQVGIDTRSQPVSMAPLVRTCRTVQRLLDRNRQLVTPEVQCAEDHRHWEEQIHGFITLPSAIAELSMVGYLLVIGVKNLEPDERIPAAA